MRLIFPGNPGNSTSRTLLELKILPNFYDRITAGIKRWEIREELPFCLPDYVKYIDATDGSTLGYHRIKSATALTLSSANFNDVKQAAIELGAISGEEYDSIFKGRGIIYAISICAAPINVKDIGNGK